MSCMLWVLSWSESLFNEREICLLRVGTIRWYRQVVADRAHAPTINFIQVYGHNICLLAVCAIVLQWNPIFLSYAMIMNWFRLHLGPLSMNDILTFWATNRQGKTWVYEWFLVCFLNYYVPEKPECVYEVRQPMCTPWQLLCSILVVFVL